MAAKSSFLNKVLGRLGRLDAEGLQSVVQRLASERSFLETLFDIIEDGVLVIDPDSRVLYCNQAATQLLGIKGDAEGRSVTDFLPAAEWEKLARLDSAGGGSRVVRHEFELDYPRP